MNRHKILSQCQEKVRFVFFDTSGKSEINIVMRHLELHFVINRYKIRQV